VKTVPVSATYSEQSGAHNHLLDVIPNGSKRKFRAVMLVLRVAVSGRHWTRCSIRTSQAVHAHDEEPCLVKRLARTPKQRTPPVADVRAAGERMADHHGIVTAGGQGASGGVGDRYIT
jgi:hypothetical protein